MKPIHRLLCGSLLLLFAQIVSAEKLESPSVLIDRNFLYAMTSEVLLRVDLTTGKGVWVPPAGMLDAIDLAKHPDWRIPDLIVDGLTPVWDVAPTDDVLCSKEVVVFRAALAHLLSVCADARDASCPETPEALISSLGALDRCAASTVAVR